MTNRYIRLSTACLLALAGCTPTPPVGTVPQPSATPSMAQSPPAVPAPTPSPSPAVSSTPPIEPSPTPTATPAMTATRLIGRVYSDDLVPLANVALSASDENGKSLGATTTDGSGAYVIENLPQEKRITLTASLAAYSARSQTLVMAGTTMTVDFRDANALTNRPEVIEITPADNATNVPPDAPIKIRFSMPVDKASVLGALAVQLDQESARSLPVGLSLPAAGWPPLANSSVYDSSNFAASWDTDSRLTLTPLAPMPALAGQGVSYRITLSYGGKIIKTPEGREARPGEVSGDRRIGPFNFGQIRPYSRFTVAPTSTANVRLSGGSMQGTRIRLQFSQPMFWDCLAGRIAGGADGNATSAAAANGTISATACAANYEITVGTNPPAFLNTMLGGKAYFDESDLQHRTVVLEANTAFATAGESVTVRITAPIKDAAGTSISRNDADNVVRMTSS